MNDETCFVGGCDKMAVDTVPNPLDESPYAIQLPVCELHLKRRRMLRWWRGRLFDMGG